MYGSTVRSARRRRGLTQVQLADIAGIAQSNISAIENDRRMPSAETLQRLLLACGFDLVAVAGTQTVHLPLPVDDDVPDIVPAAEQLDEASLRDLSMSERVRVLSSVLDAAEATVRSNAGR